MDLPTLDPDRRARAEGALATLVETGDLDRVVALARLLGSAGDALSDDVVTRLASLAGDALDLVDRVTRSGIIHALPAITALVENGDLDRIVALARVFGAAEDALNDEMISRFAALVADSVVLLDRFARSELVTHLLRASDGAALGRLAGSFSADLTAAAQGGAAKAEKGGLFGLLGLLRDPAHQETLRFVLDFGGRLRRTAAAP